MGAKLSNLRAMVIGSVMVLAAIVLALVTTVLGWPAAVAIAGWISAGGGMGLMYPRLSVMTLAMSTPDTEGFNSSAMSISDSLGGALALAATGIVFTALTTTTTAGGVQGASFAGVFALTAAIAVVAVVVAPRVAARKSS
jgi:MFS family permease